ncbi:MAG TPA: biotin/lipoyl-containing protein, partial [Candidatus Saccharimonadaceae bacterium]|nr:biotin/lipoyl-containing protein [Candidatus Saccharimonadaceae bacterium]
MPYDVKLPDIGEGIAEGEIVKWLVKAGDRVREDQPLVEVMTDKASVEIPSPRTGTIAELLAEEGAMVPVGSVIVSIAVEGESVAGGAGPQAGAAGVRLTYLAYVFRALPETLRQFPLLNASLDDDAHEILLKHEFHLGLATNTDDGLTVPIVHNADRLTLFGLAREIE